MRYNTSWAPVQICHLTKKYFLLSILTCFSLHPVSGSSWEGLNIVFLFSVLVPRHLGQQLFYSVWLIPRASHLLLCLFNKIISNEVHSCKDPKSQIHDNQSFQKCRNRNSLSHSVWDLSRRSSIVLLLSLFCITISSWLYGHFGISKMQGSA